MINMIIDIAAFQSTEFLIPFLFVLAVVFGVLGVVNVFKNKGVNLLVAAALSFFATSNSAFVSILWTYFGSVAVFFIAMFFLVFIFEVFGVRKKGEPLGADAMIINGAILFVLLSISYLYIDMIPALPFIGGGENLILFFAIIFILAIFWTAYKTGGMSKVPPHTHPR